MKQPEAARAALEAYATRVGGELGEPMPTQVTDLVADLLHLLVLEGEHPSDAERAANSGIFHFVTEDGGDDE